MEAHSSKSSSNFTISHEVEDQSLPNPRKSKIPPKDLNQEFKLNLFNSLNTGSTSYQKQPKSSKKIFACKYILHKKVPNLYGVGRTSERTQINKSRMTWRLCVTLKFLRMDPLSTLHSRWQWMPWFASQLITHGRPITTCCSRYRCRRPMIG